MHKPQVQAKNILQMICTVQNMSQFKFEMDTWFEAAGTGEMVRTAVLIKGAPYTCQTHGHTMYGS
eukprot:m.138118 g.138118  ORF g.138118 m.138118 type:complete len:65 (-) comp9947_c0_seq3:635-829(-)